MEFLRPLFRRHFTGKSNGTVAKCQLFFQATCTKKPLGSSLHSYSYCNNCYIFFLERSSRRREGKNEERKKFIKKMAWYGVKPYQCSINLSKNENIKVLIQWRNRYLTKLFRKRSCFTGSGIYAYHLVHELLVFVPFVPIEM